MAVDRKVGQLLAAIASIDARTVQTDRRVDLVNNKVDALTSMTARSPRGVTLINLVQQIHSEVVD